MAAVVTGMQVICGAGSSSRNVRLNHFSTVQNVPLFKKDLKFRVRSMAKEGSDVEAEDKKRAAIPIPTKLFSTPPPPPQPEESTNPANIMRFDGPAAERINGRLAMVGFVSAIAVELARGQDIFTQIQNGGFKWFLATTLVFSFASVVPLYRGISADKESRGFFTSDAELWNGRVAMVGLIALAYTEYLTGSTLV